MSAHGTAVAVVVVAAAGALAGCGSDPREPTPAEARAIAAPVHAYLTKLYGRRLERACEELDGDAEDDMVSMFAEELPQAGVRNCPQGIATFLRIASLDRAAAGVMDVEGTDADRFWKARVTAVEIDGDEATARVDGSGKLAHVERVDGRWLIHSLDFSDIPK